MTLFSRNYSLKRILFLVCLTAMLAVAAAPSIPARAADVLIEDPVLEKAVREELNLPSGVTITRSDMAKVEYLFMRKSQTKDQLRSLKGLEYAVNLHELDAPGNRIEDVSPLAGLNKLAYLTLDDNNVKDISSLANLEGLQMLSISHNFLENLDVLPTMRSLSEVYFEDNNVRDLAPLLGVGQLRSITATNNAINLGDEATKSVIDALKQRNVKISGDIGKQKQAPSAFKETDPRLLTWTMADKQVSLPIRDYAYGNGVFVAVGPNGIVKSSKDGVQWQTYRTGYRGDFEVVVWGNGKFIAFGQRSFGARATDVWTSADGMNWTENAKGIVNDGYAGIRDAAWNGKRFVMVGGSNGSGYIYTSEDGLSWTRRAPNLIATNLTGVAWGNGTFVASGYEGGVAAVSKDGITWKKVKTSQPNYEQIWSMTFGGGTFVAVGDYTIMTSKDGFSWKYVPSKGFWSRVDWAKDRFILLGGDWTNQRKKDEWVQVSLTSKDGAKWVDAGLAATNKQDKTQRPNFALHNGKQYVAVTNVGAQTSTDAKTWRQAKRYPIEPLSLNAAAVGNGKLIAVGGYKDRDELKLSSMASLQLSQTGAWTGSQTESAYPLYSVVWTGSQFLGVGSKGTMKTSKDGVVWQALVSPTQESLYKVIKAGDRLYAVGEKGLILSSKDGKKWTKLKSNATGAINSIAWNGSTFVAVGESGLILVSKDGSNWTKVPRNFKGAYYDVAWGNGAFAVTTAGYYGNIDSSTILRSADGQKWTETDIEDGLTIRSARTGLYGISFVGGYFVAAGAEGSIFLSPDAINWSKQDVLTQEDLNAVVEYNGKIYVVGGHGTVLSADPDSLHKAQ
ncbi:hypothetical protein D7Z26_22285 [Cohnella endophytica]|uniref:Leucine-rich repeat domain-containing protein n=1 Tax=Cohnella endophytica TaxID=2419778 RepID=A0A494XID1_9BACL|nr:leucine-rich repeat domain-containing protein [Cohnella endophytica]RKP47939.1 hypothetical protein D7Z26_22285 [Cohnella endophytica]